MVQNSKQQKPPTESAHVCTMVIVQVKVNVTDHNEAKCSRHEERQVHCESQDNVFHTHKETSR